MLANKKLNNLIVIIVITYGVLFLGTLFAHLSFQPWYQTLLKPTWGPPDWAFQIVWPTLYTLMAISAWLVQRKQFYYFNNSSFIWYVIQLFFNLAWTFFFFVLKSPTLALIDMVLLFCTLLVTIMSFARVSTVAGWLLFPYLIWIIYAGAINLMIWTTNP